MKNSILLFLLCPFALSSFAAEFLNAKNVELCELYAERVNNQDLEEITPGLEFGKTYLFMSGDYGKLYNFAYDIETKFNNAYEHRNTLTMCLRFHDLRVYKKAYEQAGHANGRCILGYKGAKSNVSIGWTEGPMFALLYKSEVQNKAFLFITLDSTAPKNLRKFLVQCLEKVIIEVLESSELLAPDSDEN